MLDPAEIRRREYTGRINRVMDYVRGNLSGDLRLETLARVANFSPYHFHRVFKAIAGETTTDFIRRHRAQKAASHLLQNPRMTITQIAMACGYSSPSSFAREFRRWFDVSASQFRAGGRASLKALHSSSSQAAISSGNRLESPPGPRKPMKFEANARTLPERNAVYIRHVGRYDQISRSFERLMRWAGPRDLLRSPETLILAIYHDNPDVTPIAKLRSDACITVPEGTPVSDDVGRITIPGGLFAVAHVEIDPSQYGEAWDRLMSDWLPRSGYQPDDRLCYEIYLNNPARHPQHKHIVDICEPIRPL